MIKTWLALLLLAAATPLRAGTNPFLEPSDASSGASASSSPPEAGWGFNLSLGYGGINGDFSTSLQKPVSGDFSLFRKSGPWRFGAGLSFGSFVLRSPYSEVPPQVTIVGYPVGNDWAFHQIYLSAARMFRLQHAVRPYLQVRGGIARMHPRSLVFAPNPIPADFVPESSPTKATNGFSVGVIPGIEWRLSRSISLDTSFSWTYFDTGSYDLSAVGLPPESWGEAWEARLGITWHLDDGQPSGPAGKSVSPDRPRDAWGVERNYGWAAAEVLAINIVATEMEEFKSNLNYTQTSDRSWWRNFETGGTYDDNLFRNNQLIHPYNGATYFNGARANGLNFWTSYGYAFAGSFFWECCSENHPIALNDQVSTGIGGPAMGEALFRISSEILDNRSTGWGRAGREAAAFLVDPVRGLNRGLSGRWGAQDDNPSDPQDWRPSGSSTFLASGIRTIGEGDSIKNNTDSYAFVELDHAFGDEFENPRRKPFDYFDTQIQFNFGDKHPIGEFQIRGDLWSKPLGSGDHPNHVFSIVQHYEYMNNTDYEFGGQSFGPSLLSRFRLADRLWLQTRVDGIGMLLGGVNSDYSHFAQVADVTRLREYDYGSGLGVAGEATLARSRWPLLKLAYRFQWLNVHNGSVFDRGPNLQGENANHYIQFAEARVSVPLFRGLGIGGDAYLFLRDSHYQFQVLGVPIPENLSQRNPQVHVYLSWGPRG
ncbi:MAG TPA: DUF3943 domain-containing protein [Vicinamibacteria bacterium]|nr:DUF3943 domain-containing protein [Vicinamibacteria bacterium]